LRESSSLTGRSTTSSATISDTGYQAAVEQYHALMADSTDAYNFSSNDLNTLGYKQLQAGNVEAGAG